MKKVIDLRNKFWKKNPIIPSWVDIEEIGLDQFFTKKDVAEYCFKSLENFLKNEKFDPLNYKFVEPSAGMGAFYNLLPNGRRVGIDVCNFNDDYINTDFLSWQPKKNGYRYICVGNPPFGYRAWLALAFLNNAAKFSDVVGFILPMSFQSKGKSNVQNRVKGMSLAHSEILPQDSFIDENGKTLKVNALWQIWVNDDCNRNFKKQENNYTCNKFIDLFTVDLRKERKCGHNRMHEADYFLQRTFYSDPPKLVKSFDEVKYVCGYGIVIKKQKNKIKSILNNADWVENSNLASHNCRHISMHHIREVLFKNGFLDD